MAFVGHSPVHEFRAYAVSAAAKGYSLTAVKSVVVAFAATAAILALSEVGGTAATTTAMIKGDRIAAPQMAAVARASSFVDAGSRTTTIEKGAAQALAPDSPFRDMR